MYRQNLTDLKLPYVNYAVGIALGVGSIFLYFYYETVKLKTWLKKYMYLFMAIFVLVVSIVMCSIGP